MPACNWEHLSSYSLGSLLIESVHGCLGVSEVTVVQYQVSLEPHLSLEP